MSDLGPLEALAQGQALEFTAVERVGPDMRLLPDHPDEPIF